MAQNIYRVDWRHKGGRYHDRVLFFFQAEDGIRDLTVTGVQTCALPIYLLGGRVSAHHDEELGRSRHGHGTQDTFVRPMRIFSGIQPTGEKHLGNYIGADRKSTRLNSSHSQISYAVFCLKKKNTNQLLTASMGRTHSASANPGLAKSISSLHPPSFIPCSRSPAHPSASHRRPPCACIQPN